MRPTEHLRRRRANAAQNYGHRIWPLPCIRRILTALSAQEFNPVLAVLLIDTDDKSAMYNYIARLNKPYPQDDLQIHLKDLREWLYFRGRDLYVVGVPNSIQESLLAVLRFYHDRVRFVPLVGEA